MRARLDEVSSTNEAALSRGTGKVTSAMLSIQIRRYRRSKAHDELRFFSLRLLAFLPVSGTLVASIPPYTRKPLLEASGKELRVRLENIPERSPCRTGDVARSAFKGRYSVGYRSRCIRFWSP